LGILGIVILVSSIAAASFYLVTGTKKEAESIDVYGDYKHFLEAAYAYKNEYDEYAKDIHKFKEYIKEFESMPIKRYGLSLDGKFLTISKLSKDEATCIINEVGGESHINNEVVYLTLVRKNELSEVRPVAHFSIRPDNKITTTTLLQYDLSRCITENNEILEKKWENGKTTFKEPGKYTITLTIKDRNGNWSEPFSKEIHVTDQKGIRSIRSYGSSFFLIYNNGHAFASGKNEFAQLGINSILEVESLKNHSEHDGVKDVSCSEDFTLFLMNDGTVCSSGANLHGALGTGDHNSQRSLSPIWGLENIKQVAAGKQFSAALDVNGHVYVWGDNSLNQLMQEEIDESLMPIKLEHVENVKQIAVGDTFGLALLFDGTVFGWGDNSHGQLALGYKGKISEPVITLYKGVSKVVAGEKYSLALTESGIVYGAGNNAFGQLGVKGKTESLFPIEIMKIKNVEMLEAKDSLVVATTSSGIPYIWGNFNSPGIKPIFEPEEINDIHFPKFISNSGRKCYLTDHNNKLFIISDNLGKFESYQLGDTVGEMLALINNNVAN